MVWDLLPTAAHSAITIRERYADGRATEADLRASSLLWRSSGINAQSYALAAARGATGYRWTDTLEAPTNWDESSAAREAAKALAASAAGPAPLRGRATEGHATYHAAFAAARAHQAELGRDIFPPPGYAPGLRAEWRTSTVEAIARQMDATGDFSAVPILADALQDAGCDDETMLDRCRAPFGVHCRGNWVVDLVLGRV